MPRKFICNLTKTELNEIYNRDGMTIKKMCSIVGCKSDITMAKILHTNGINTNNNQKTAYFKRGNRTDIEFEKYLISEYVDKKRSMTSIAKELNISNKIVSNYLDKYKIKKRTKSEQQSGHNSATWKGGRRICSNGYIEVLCPGHPGANSRNTVYEHRLIAEQKIGRYLLENEVVHHIDRNKQNNSPENLLVLAKEEHTKLHLEEMHKANRKKEVVSS